MEYPTISESVNVVYSSITFLVRIGITEMKIVLRSVNSRIKKVFTLLMRKYFFYIHNRHPPCYEDIIIAPHTGKKYELI